MQKCDSQYHWSECSLCGAIVGKTAHSLVSKDSLKLCHPSNKRTSFCSECNYSATVSYREGECNYRYSGVYWLPDYGGRDEKWFALEQCRNCGVNAGHSEYYTYPDGSAIDWVNITFPVTIKRNTGEEYTVSSARNYKAYSSLIVENLVKTLSADKSMLTVSGTYRVGDDYKDMIRTLLGTGASYKLTYNLYYFSINNPAGYDWKQISVSPQSIIDGSLPFSCTFDVCDMTRDYSAKPYISLGLTTYHAKDGISTEYYTNGFVITLDDLLFYREPTVSQFRVN